MVQIISDRQSNWTKWLGEVFEHLGEYPSVSKIVVFADVENDKNSHAQIIEFMNCGTSDVYNIGGILQKESIKHEIAEEFGLEDEEWEEYDED